MADVDIVFTPGWYEDHIDPLKNRLAVSTMSAVRDDARRIVPIDTGALRDSLTVILAAPGVARMISHLPYFAAVELGFHGEEWVRQHMRLGRPVRGHVRHGNTPAQPFARPSLYRKRQISLAGV